MDKLNILWTSDNKDTFFSMLSMYVVNSKKNAWWKNINLIIWGASVKLSGNDSKVQNELKEMMDNGINIEACLKCAESFDVKEKLESIGVKVQYMGVPLTDYIKNGEKLLSI